MSWYQDAELLVGKARIVRWVAWRESLIQRHEEADVTLFPNGWLRLEDEGLFVLVPPQMVIEVAWR